MTNIQAPNGQPGRYNATPATRNDGDQSGFEFDSLGNLKITFNTLLAGEDLQNNLIVVENRYNYANITTQTTTTVKSGAGFLHAITFGKPLASGVVAIYDNTTNSAPLIGTITFPATLLSDVGTYVFNVSFATGLTIVTSGATQDITVSFR